YLYGHPWQMNELVGAKNVGYVPVWSSTDQLHIGKNALGRTLRHELVHVLAKQFGNRIIKASWSIGLLEGIAVALSPASREITTIDQTVAANAGTLSTDDVRRLLSPTGFYSGRGAVNYTIAGSFVGYLLREYPVQYFKESYYLSNIEKAYPQPLDTLVEDWHTHLAEINFDIREQRAGEQLFEMPSIFEGDCPRMLSDEYRLSDRYLYYMAENDTVSALLALKELFHLDPENQDAWRYWSSLNFTDNGTMDLWEIIPDHSPRNPFYLIKQADYAMLNGTRFEAEKYLGQFESALDNAGANEFRDMLNRRKNNQNWAQLVAGLYRTSDITKEDFDAMNEETRFHVVRKMLSQNNRTDIIDFLNLLTAKKYQPFYFNTYLSALEYASLSSNYQTSKKLAAFISQQDLRPLEKVKLDELIRFDQFFESAQIEQPD
ncbi:MAG: hypothetical protein WD491_04860, partial [Balneolales bacterium]